MGFLDFHTAGGGARADASIDAAELPADALAWSDAGTWSGRLPGRDTDAVIAHGRTVVVDQDVHVRSLTVFGTLLFAARALKLRSGWILVAGAGVLRAGSLERPRHQPLTLTLDGSADGNVHGLGSRFLAAVRGGTIDLHGRRCESWVLLGDSPMVGSRFLRTADPVDWHARDRIAVASGGAELPLVEERTLCDVDRDGRGLTLDIGVTHRHPGKYGPVQRPQPSSIAKVVLLSRSIVIEGDGAGVERGIGGQCVVRSVTPDAIDAVDDAARTSIGRFRHVEFRRLGQFNRVDRFPVFWFANGDSSTSSLIDCLIHDCHQRGLVVRGSPHVRVSGNVVYKPYGHGYVIEQTGDAAQMMATNLAVRPRVVRFADPALRGLHEHRPRAFWFGVPRPPTVNRTLR